MAFQNATCYNNGASFYGDPKDWSQYSTLTSTISFNDTNAKLKAVPEQPDSNTRLYWNNEVLAYKSEIPDLANWAQYPANHQLDVPDPYVIFANAGVGGESVRSFINNLDCSTLRVSSMTVQNQVTVNNINVSTINASTITAKNTQFENATISSLTVSTINLPNPVLSVSTIDVALTLTSTLQFATLQPEVKFDLGLGSLFNNTALYAAGGLGLTIGGTAVVTGLAGAILNRQTNYLPGVANPIELVNTTTQLQVSTLGTGQIAYFRTINPGTGAEEFVRQDTVGNDLCIRSVSDPLMNISSNGAGGTISSFYQSFGQWVTIPRPAYAWNGNATTDLNMNYSTIVSTANVVFEPKVIGVQPTGLRSQRNAPASQYNMLESFVDFNGVPNTYISGMRVSELALSNRPSNTASDRDYDLSLTSTGQPPVGPPPANTYYRRILATSYNGGNAASTYTVAYTSDNLSTYDIWCGAAVPGSTPNGTILAPYTSLGDAITAVNAFPNDTQTLTLHIMTGTYNGNLVITRNNVFIVGVSFDEDRNDVNIQGSITFTVASSSTIVNGIVGLNCYQINVNCTAAQQNITTIKDCFIQPITGISCIVISAPVLNTCAVYVNNCTLIILSNLNGSCISADGLALTLHLYNSNLFQTNASNPNTLIGTSCNTIMRYCNVRNNSAIGTVLPIFTFNLGANSTNYTGVMAFNTIQYTSTASDAGNGNKCCVRITTLAGYGSYTMTITHNFWFCEGATTTNGSAGQFLCLQKTSTGNASVNHGSLIAGSTANHLPNSSATFTKGSYVTVI